MITAFPKLCPNLHDIGLIGLPRDSMITVAVSELVLTTNQNTLQYFHVDSPLTMEACQVIYKLPNLCTLRAIIDSSTALPTMVLPGLAAIYIEYHNGHEWLQGFRGASLGKLTSVAFSCKSDSIDSFLGAFESVALTTSIPTTLSTFQFYTKCQWRPSYRSLLPFTQLRELVIESDCGLGCSSTIDDDTITDLARTMPQLETLELGDRPCETPSAGVTVKGLTALTYYCPRLFELVIHFQVDGLDPPDIPCLTSTGEPTIPQEGCILELFHVGETCVPEESAMMVALTLLNLFPRLRYIDYSDGSWEKVDHAIQNSKRLIHCSSEKRLVPVPRST